MLQNLKKLLIFIAVRNRSYKGSLIVIRFCGPYQGTEVGY